MDNLCLYGHANGTWTVGLPTEEVPTEMPEPTLGINYARDGMKARNMHMNNLGEYVLNIGYNVEFAL